MPTGAEGGYAVGWLAAVIGVIFCIWLMVVSPTFRRAIFVSLVLAGAGIYKLIAQSNEDDARYREREAASRTLIQPSQLVLNDVKLGESYGLWQVNGTVQNNSQYPLSQFWLHVTVQHCPAAPFCVTIGEDDVGIDVKVPPGQLRSFDRNVYLANLPTAQRMTWAYRIDGVKAEMP
jgi:hypothetical protein